MKIDLYRVNLFKKNLREIIGAPWARFYFSKGKCHLCLYGSDLGEKNAEIALSRLRNGGIQVKENRNPFGLWSNPEKRPIWTLNIPIDQEALPERCLAKRKRSKGR